MDKVIKATILPILFVIYFIVDTEAKLRLLSVVFRHGDRAPDNNGLEIYPTDPHINKTFEPTGLGELTNSGKLREYRLGEYIRKQYGDFLGRTFYPAEIHARSTHYDRTKMSLQLVLAGLYPPRNKQIWNRNLNWQPIPAHYLPSLDDVLMGPEECPKYIKAREKAEASPKVLAKMEAFKDFMQYLTEKTGRKVSHPKDMYFLYQALSAEKSMNLTLPRWTKDIFPHGKLLDGMTFEYELFSYDTEMRRLNGGMFLRKFVDDMTACKNGTLDKRSKLFLYSGHETNIVAILQALGVFNPPHVPEYTSAIFIELHEKYSEYYVKVKYYKGIPQEHREMTIAGCEINCTLDKFKTALSDVIATDDDINCDKRSLRKPLENHSLNLPAVIQYTLLRNIRKEDSIKNTLY